MPEDTITKELNRLRSENEVIQQKNIVLEESCKGLLKENTQIMIDLNVLKDKIKKLEQSATPSGQNKGLDILQNRLDFKIQEADDLRKQLNEARTMLIEMEKKIQKLEIEHKDVQKKEHDGKNIASIIESLQKENEQLKAQLKRK